MKQLDTKCLLRVLMTFLVLAAAGLVNAQVYKSVDENGTVVYSDEPPVKGAQPIELPPISVIEAPEYKKGPAESDRQPDNSSAPSLRELRHDYKDFAIVAPKQDESIWHPTGPVTAAWSTPKPLQPGMQVSLMLDGQKQAPTTAQIIPLGNLDRGEHTLQAVLVDARKRNIATTVMITFYIRQPNIFSRPQAPPAGSGGAKY